LRENPWTLSKKRKPVSREVSDEDENGGPSNRKSDRDESPGFEVIDSPCKKVAKAAEVSTPGQTARDTVQNAADSLPTPDTSFKGRLLQETLPAPRLEDAINLDGERRSNLTSAVLRLLREEGIVLSSSIEIMIAHEIDTELEVNEAKVRGYEKTVLTLRKKLNEMDNVIQQLGVVGVDDPMELSD
jgi:hypothetical protein